MYARLAQRDVWEAQRADLSNRTMCCRWPPVGSNRPVPPILEMADPTKKLILGRFAAYAEDKLLDQPPINDRGALPICVSILSAPGRFAAAAAPGHLLGGRGGYTNSETSKVCI